MLTTQIVNYKCKNVCEVKHIKEYRFSDIFTLGLK